MSRIFGHYIPRSLLNLALVEFLVLFCAFYAAVALRFPYEQAPSELHQLLHLKALAFVAAIFICLVAVGLYARGMREGYIQVVIKLAVSYFLAFFLLAFLYYISPSWFVGRGVLLLSITLSFAFLLLVRYVYTNLVGTNLMNIRVLVIGTGSMAKQLEMLKRKSDWQGLTLVGFLHLKGDVDEVVGHKVLPLQGSVVQLVDDYAIDEIVVAVEEHRKNYPVDELIRCKMKGIRVTEICEFFEKRSGKLQINTLRPGRFIYIDGFDQDSVRITIKRCADISLSLLILLLTLPVYPLLILMIKKESGWKEPAFYSQLRVGQDEKQFMLYKFRSMVVDAEINGAQWASENDSRVTKVGEFMRKNRLDELPQLWNVLKGEMSFVGPRPERPEFVELLAEKIPYYRMRHRVKPGITGWAQICYPYGDDEIDAKEKLQFDLYYIKNYSIFLDLTILAQTAQVILWQKGAR